MRQLEVLTQIRPQDLDIKESFSASGLILGRLAVGTADDFVGDTLNLFNLKDE